MSPERAILPMTPDPGSTGSRFSSKTTVCAQQVHGRPALHRGVAGGHDRHAVVAALGGADGVGDHDVGQVLEELVLDRCARTARPRTRRPTARRGRGRCPRRRATRSSGLPMASPVIITELTFSSSTSRQTSWGSNLAIRTILEPTKLWPMTHHCVAPCMSGATGRWTRPPPAPLATMDAGSVDARVGDGVGAAAEGVEDVLVAPDDALGHAGRAAGVEDVEVVARAGAEVALRPTGRPARPRSAIAPGVGLDVGPVLDHDHVAQLRAARAAARATSGENSRWCTSALQIGVGQQVAQLVLDVAVVDVDPDGPQLEDGPGGLDPLDRVVGVDPDVVARADALGGEVVGQLVGPGLHLGVGAPLAVRDQVLPLGVGVDGRLEQVGEVELHRPQIRTRSRSGGNRAGCVTFQRLTGCILRTCQLKGVGLKFHR